MKFVGRIIMTILFVFICIGAYAGDDLLKYEIEGEGVGVQGTYLVKVTVIQKKSKLDIDVIKKCAVHGVLFKGFSSQTSRTRQKPLAGSMVVEQQHQDYFDVFFQKGGSYINFANMIGENLSVTNNVVIMKDCCKRAFIRGAFMAAGSISDPNSSYHFEIKCNNEIKAEQLI